VVHDPRVVLFLLGRPGVSSLATMDESSCFLSLLSSRPLFSDSHSLDVTFTASVVLSSGGRARRNERPLSMVRHGPISFAGGRTEPRFFFFLRHFRSDKSFIAECETFDIAPSSLSPPPPIPLLNPFVWLRQTRGSAASLILFSAA